MELAKNSIKFLSLWNLHFNNPNFSIFREFRPNFAIFIKKFVFSVKLMLRYVWFSLDFAISIFLEFRFNFAIFE